ncbi:hypothetical protein AB205_0109010 [Aquarana catesbeiana]|uniref:Uncharacterized protein n=1 Tax=Aquarana catesbeiana TaxID=8400 RepID=A0A2G9RLN3_AQUCT|nr:hypothetical protein AB205_0109010 [Aquarana catesbeiana]
MWRDGVSAKHRPTCFALPCVFLGPPGRRKVEACQGDLSTLANVVTSLANLNKTKDLSQSSTELSIMESLSNGDASLSELPQDDQSSSEVTRAFDTLAKALNPSESSVQSSAESIDAASNIFGDATVVEIEGPLLTDSHIAFKKFG